MGGQVIWELEKWKYHGAFVRVGGEAYGVGRPVVQVLSSITLERSVGTWSSAGRAYLGLHSFLDLIGVFASEIGALYATRQSAGPRSLGMPYEMNVELSRIEQLETKTMKQHTKYIPPSLEISTLSTVILIVDNGNSYVYVTGYLYRAVYTMPQTPMRMLLSLFSNVPTGSIFTSLLVPVSLRLLVPFDTLLPLSKIPSISFSPDCIQSSTPHPSRRTSPLPTA